MVVEHQGEEWFTAKDIGQALGFAGDAGKAIHKIYERNKDEFPGLTSSVKLTHEGKLRTHRIFNAQAAVKFGFFGKTKRAKAFRHWDSRFLSQGVKRLKDRHKADQKRVRELEGQLMALPDASKAAQRIWRLEKRVKELTHDRDAVADSARYLIKDCHKKIDRLQGLLDQGVEARLLEAEKVMAVHWEALRRLAALAGNQEENLGTRLLHAVLARQEEYEAFIRHLKVNLGRGNIKISFRLDPNIYCREIEELAEEYRQQAS